MADHHEAEADDPDAALPDGAYEAMVVDVLEPAEDAEGVGDGVAGALRLELTIVSGVRKGEVVAVRTDAAGADPLDWLGLPVQLDVTEGRPSVRVDP